MEQQDRAFLYYVLSKFISIVDKGQTRAKTLLRVINTFYRDKVEKLYQRGLTLSINLFEGKEKYKLVLVSLALFKQRLEDYQKIEIRDGIAKFLLANDYIMIIAKNLKKNIYYAFKQMLELYNFIYEALYSYYITAQTLLIDIGDYLQFIHSCVNALFDINVSEEMKTYLIKLKKDLSFEAWENLWRLIVIEPMKEFGEIKVELVKYYGLDVEDVLLV